LLTQNTEKNSNNKKGNPEKRTTDMSPYNKNKPKGPNKPNWKPKTPKGGKLKRPTKVGQKTSHGKSQYIARMGKRGLKWVQVK
jgi:hypothetical protein